MALGRDRTPQGLQGFDPDFFGGGCSDGHLSSLLDVDLQEDSQSIVNFKAAAALADHWAYPNVSSVLSFEQGDWSSSGAKYPNLHQEEECSASWVDTMGSHDPHGYPCTDSRRGGDHFRLLYPSVSGRGSGTAGCLQEGGRSTERGQKRPYMVQLR